MSIAVIEPGDSELESRLADAWEAGKAAWPAVRLDVERYVRHVRAQLPAARPAEGLARLASVELYLACACLHGVPGADGVLERVYLVHVDQFGRRVDASAAFADEVRQLLREKLLLATPGKPPRIGEYTGAGPLVAWLRVAAVRTALNLRRDRGVGRAETLDEELIDAAAGRDAELDIIKERYREAFQQAVQESLAELPDDHRRAMRLHLVGHLTTAKIGQLFQVNQSTVVRWLSLARTTVRERSRSLLRERLQLSPSELESLTALLLSRLDISLETALRTVTAHDLAP